MSHWLQEGEHCKAMPVHMVSIKQGPRGHLLLDIFSKYSGDAQNLLGAQCLIWIIRYWYIMTKVTVWSVRDLSFKVPLNLLP